MVNTGKQIGGEWVHVRDCYVWAEIHYLDSLTDYREFLPQHFVPPHKPESELVMLDSSWSEDVWGALVAFALSLVVAVSLFLLYLEL